MYIGLVNIRYFWAHPDRSAAVNFAAMQAAVDLNPIDKGSYVPVGEYHINDRLHVYGALGESTGHINFVA